MRLRPAALIAIVSLAAGLILTGCIKYKTRPLSATVMEQHYRARSVDSAGVQKFVQSLGWRQWPPAILDLDALTAIAAYYSPDLDVARAQIAIADAEVRTANVRINPSLNADGGYYGEPGAHPLYGISPGFTIETAGKRGYRTLQAQKNADAARLSFAEAQWLLWSKVRLSLLDYVLSERRLGLLEREAGLRAQLAEMLEKRLQVGAVSQPNVDVYRVELLKAQAAAESAKGDVAQKRVALATAVGIPPEALEHRPIEYRNLDAPPAEISVSLRKVRKAGLIHRIDIRSMLVDYAAADAALKLEIARQYPDLQLAPGYGFQEGFVSYTFSSVVNALPVFNRNKGPIAAAEARRRQVEARFRALQSQAIGEMAKALELYSSAFDAWQIESNRLKQIEQDREQAARRALQTGQGDRFTLVLAEIETNTAALGQLNALMQVQTNLGALEDSVQQPLEAGVGVPEAPEVNPRHEVTQ
jgi:outer membrane protein TolC